MRTRVLTAVVVATVLAAVGFSTSGVRAETREGRFIVKPCPPSHIAQVDPIVNPGPLGTLSHHVHEFFGNRTTNSDSTYASMIAGDTTCERAVDTAGYWAPTLVAPDGTRVVASGITVYYFNHPTSYSDTVPFPADFRMIAGGVGTRMGSGSWFWNCKAGGGKYTTPPKCAPGDIMRAIIFFPQCWDGVRNDSPDHRSHMAYPRNNACPASHPVKLPRIKLYIRYPSSAGGPGYALSDGTTVPHADFWNTWNQAELEKLVRECLNGGVMCGRE